MLILPSGILTLGSGMLLRSWVDIEAAIAAQAERKFEHQELLELVKPLKMVSVPDCFQNLPHIRNTKFYGREAELQRLITHLQPQQPPSTLHACGLYGIGGSGKSQLALEFAYRNLAHYNAVFWISGETELKLAESFAAPAFALGVAGEYMQQLTQVRDIFKDWLYSSSRESKSRPSLVLHVLLVNPAHTRVSDR
jgi:hypothetical protein